MTDNQNKSAPFEKQTEAYQIGWRRKHNLAKGERGRRDRLEHCHQIEPAAAFS